MDEVVDKVPTPQERRMGNSSKAITTYRKVYNDSSERRKDDARVLAQLTGARPYSDSALKSAGRGWQANLNFRDGASQLEQVQVGYWRLLHDVKDMAHITVDTKTPQATEIEKVLQKNFTRFYNDWGASYTTQYLKMSFNHTAFGAGPVLFTDKESPRYTAIRRGDLVVPDKAPSDVSKWELCWIRVPVTLDEMWQRVRTEEAREASEEVGWNIDVLRKMIIRARNGVNSSTDMQDWLEVEREMRTQSMSTSCEKGEILEVHQLIKEFDGKVSRQVIYPELVQEGEDIDEYAFDDYEVEDRPDTMLKYLHVIFFEVGPDGMYHEVRGFGRKNYDLATAQNRLKSRFMDGTLLDGLNFVQKTEGKADNLDIVNIGPFNIFPANFDPINVSSSRSTLGEAIALLDQQTSFNNARYRDQSRSIEQSQTATQANILANLQSQVDVANATLFLNQISRLLTEQMSRLMDTTSDDPDAKLFQERCESDNIGKEILDEVQITVRTSANPGVASSAVRAQVATQMLSQQGNPLVNPRWALEQFISASLGANEIEKALVPEGSATQSDKELRMAIMENSDMGDGNELPVDRSDAHHIHLQAHLPPLESIVFTYQDTQSINPEQLVALQSSLPHISAHAEFLNQDPFRQAEYQQLWPRVSQVISIAEGIQTRLEELTQQAEETGQLPGQAQQLRDETQGQNQNADQIQGAQLPAGAVGSPTI